MQPGEKSMEEIVENLRRFQAEEGIQGGLLEDSHDDLADELLSRDERNVAQL
ncbi:hypothetical protein [uncultured Corynebacterium sp.]|uniref:hypothetical protein n=1 Tax=uncultured Corynebacterium sp. TaxID=159447 RepID=UPI002593609D|nr:hypothetical protein [uncultured Corynebacterium sp.]